MSKPWVQLNRHGEELGGYMAFREMSEEYTDPALRQRFIKVIRQVIDNELTPRQRQLIEMYYFDNQSMTAIGQQLGINKSTVSRCLKTAQKRITRCVKYLA